MFLFPPKVYFEQAMRESMSLPSNCIWRRDVWIFQEETVPTHELDLRVGNEFQQSVQEIGDIAIVMVNPIATGVVENLRLHTHEQVHLVLIDLWTEERMPFEVDEVERTPMELKRLIDCYLPEKWELVAVGITTTLVEVIKNSFVGSQVIVFDGSTHRTQFLYNSLEAMRTTRSGVGQTSRGEPSFSQPLGSMNEYDNVIDDVEVDSEDGEDLRSEDTPVRDGFKRKEQRRTTLKTIQYMWKESKRLKKPLKRLTKTMIVKKMMMVRKKWKMI